MELWLVIGHFTPTDDDPDEEVQGKLDAGVAVRVCATKEEADDELLWYTDGIVRKISLKIGD